MSLLLQIARFCVAGGAGVIIYYITLYSLTEWAGMWYLVSSVVAFFLNQVTNFTLQKYWTFQNKDMTGIHGQAARYLAMAISFLFLNTVLLYFLVEYLHIQYLIAQAVLTIFLSTLSFLITQKIFTR